MVLQNTFVGLESFIQPEIFESEMKFLRDSDDNIETSTGDGQNVEHGKSTTPKTIRHPPRSGQHSPTTPDDKSTAPPRSNRGQLQYNQEVKSKKNLKEISKSPQTAKVEHIPQHERTIPFHTQRRATNKVAPSTPTAPKASDRSSQNYNREAKLNNSSEPYLANKDSSRNFEINQRTPTYSLDYEQNSSGSTRNISHGTHTTQDLDPTVTATLLGIFGMNDKSSNEKGEHISHVGNESSMPVFLSYTPPNHNTGTDVKYLGHESKKENVIEPSQSRGSGQYDNVTDCNKLAEHERNPKQEYKHHQSKNQATLDGSNRQKITRPLDYGQRSGGSSSYTSPRTQGLNPKITATPSGRLGANYKSSDERRENVSHVGNESSTTKPLSPSCTRPRQKAVVIYHDHESTKENVIQQSQNRRSGQCHNERNNVLAQHERSPKQEYKQHQSKNQTTLEGRTNTPLETIQAEESSREELQNKRKKTLKNQPSLWSMCFGKTPKRILNKPYSVPGPQAKHEEKENENDDVQETKF